jgi:hypothetical protein
LRVDFLDDSYHFVGGSPFPSASPRASV